MNQINCPRTIVVGYRKEAGISRLLEKIFRASKIYKDLSVTISLDGGSSAEVKKVAEKYSYLIGVGRCEIIQHESNLGLREHVLKCGDLAKKYGSIVVFEDDIYPDLHYFEYARRAIEYYSKFDEVSQIALYSPKYNETASLPFIPASTTGKSVYFMQLPCSWGQIWTRSQWSAFREWYEKNKAIDFSKCNEMPSNIAKWSEKSWKKYYTLFLIRTNRYTAYPYRSYATNCGDPDGEHSGRGNYFLNTEIQDSYPSGGDLNFADVDQSRDKYDSYMEPHPDSVRDKIPADYHDLSIDLYGTKSLSLLSQTAYAITSKPTTTVILQFPTSFKPIQKNLEFGFNGVGGKYLLKLTAVDSISKGGLSLGGYGALAQSLSYYPICTKRNILSLVLNKALAAIAVVRQ